MVASPSSQVPPSRSVSPPRPALASSRKSLQTPSEQAAQAVKPEPKEPSQRPADFDAFVCQLEQAEAGSALFVREATRLLNERRVYPRYAPEPCDPAGLMKKLAAAMASSDVLTETEKWGLVTLYQGRRTLCQRGGAILNNLPRSAIRWLADSAYVSDPFCVSEETMLLANALGDIGRLLEHAGKSTIRQARAAASGLGAPGWAMCLWSDRRGQVQVRSQYMAEETA